MQVYMYMQELLHTHHREILYFGKRTLGLDSLQKRSSRPIIALTFSRKKYDFLDSRKEKVSNQNDAFVTNSSAFKHF